MGYLLIALCLGCGDSMSTESPIWTTPADVMPNEQDQDMSMGQQYDAGIMTDAQADGWTASHNGDAPTAPSQYPTFVEAARCGPSTNGPELKAHLTEADPDYAARVQNFDAERLPELYDLERLEALDRWLLEYALDQRNLTKLNRQTLLERGLMGRAILLALGDNPNPTQVDFAELRRGLYHFYNCDRGHPAHLTDFKLLYGDYTTWPSTVVESSRPKNDPRRLWHNDEDGVYVAETVRDGTVSETEIILANHRHDGALDFITYSPSGRIASRGEFKTGAEPAVGPSPYTCLSCHYDAAHDEYSIFP